MSPDGHWWLSSTEHVICEQVPAAPAEVRDVYCDLGNLTRLHPLVASVRLIGREDGADRSTRRYRIRDRIPLGPFTMAVSYTARVEVPDQGDVLTDARQFPRVRLHGRVSFEQVTGGTRLVERLRIDAPRPLAAVTARKAVEAHVAMLAAIRRLFQ